MFRLPIFLLGLLLALVAMASAVHTPPREDVATAQPVAPQPAKPPAATTPAATPSPIASTYRGPLRRMHRMPSVYYDDDDDDYREHMAKHALMQMKDAAGNPLFGYNGKLGCYPEKWMVKLVENRGPERALKVLLCSIDGTEPGCPMAR